MFTFFKTWKQDLPAGLVVFLVALPLCLGIGLASTSVDGVSGLPQVLAGLLAGIVGGTVVALISGSKLGVSGPAAGLITIVVSAIQELGSYEAFLLALILAGIIQFILGFVGFGTLASYIPNAVIKGMLAAIGIMLILKEIPHLIGYDQDFFGDESFWQLDGHNTFSELFYAINAFEMGAMVIGFGAICILVFFDSKWVKNKSLSKYLPGALVVVVFGVVLNQFFLGSAQVSGKHLVVIPEIGTLEQLKHYLHHPDWYQVKQPKVWITAFTLSLVASLETLLSVEATDKIDPEKEKTNPHLELKAQGIGNLVSGLLGGLPITQVIVRSSANISAGAKSKLAAFIHGIFLLLSVLFLSGVLNLIPLAALAAILILVGYKLAKWTLFKEMFQKGRSEWLPFLVTIMAILFMDLLKGIALGMLVYAFFSWQQKRQQQNALEEDQE